MNIKIMLIVLALSILFNLIGGDHSKICSDKNYRCSWICWKCQCSSIQTSKITHSQMQDLNF